MIKNFKIQELVCNHAIKQFSETQLWGFLDPRLIATIDVLRNTIFNVGMTVNSGTAHQRGLRCNLCPLVKNSTRAYMSAHVLGRGIDFNVKGMTAKQAIKVIEANADKLPYPIRIEIDNVERVHVDVMTNTQKKKISYFYG